MSTEADWEAVIERVATVGQPLDGFRQTLEQGRAAGRTVSRRQVETVLEQGAVAASDESSFHKLEEKLAATDFGNEALTSRLATAVGQAKAEYSSFNEYLRSTYLPDAVEHDGVGEERYQLATKSFLGTDIDPAATYRWGWDEVERLWSEMQQACAVINPDVSVAEVIHDLQNLSLIHI